MCHADLDPKYLMADAARRMAPVTEEASAETKTEDAVRPGWIPALRAFFARGKRAHV